MSYVTSRDGTRIAYDRSGEGPALILVGGAFQYRAFDVRTVHLAALLAAHFTVFHYDRRGSGESGDTLSYAVEREIEDIEALINEAGGSAYVFGHSSGAVLGLHAVASGLTIPKLALYEPPFIVDDSHAPLTAEYHARLAELVGWGRRGDAVTHFMTMAVGVPAAVVAGMRNDPVWPMFEAVAHTLPYDDAIMGDTLSGSPLPLQRWATVTIPTLVMDGGASPVRMHSAADALASALPQASRLTLQGQDHGVAPEVLAPELVEFFMG
jgi:pimeloyl-ACP methyl ester carboxylesterase